MESDATYSFHFNSYDKKRNSYVKIQKLFIQINACIILGTYRSIETDIPMRF